jgi:hypothetical protein
MNGEKMYGMKGAKTDCLYWHNYFVHAAILYVTVTVNEKK